MLLGWPPLMQDYVNKSQLNIIALYNTAGLANGTTKITKSAMANKGFEFQQIYTGSYIKSTDDRSLLVDGDRCAQSMH